MKRTVVGFIRGAAILLGLFGGVTGTAAGGAVTLSAPEPYEGGGSGGGVVQLHFAKSTVLAEQAGSGPSKNRVGPTASVA